MLLVKGKLPQVVKNLKDFKKSDLDVYESVNEAANKIADIRKILKTKKGKRIDSIFMDVETAEKVIKHYKSLKGSAKEKFARQKIQNIVKSIGESVNEAGTKSIDGIELLTFLMKRFNYSKKKAIDVMKKHKMDTSFLKNESVNEAKSKTMKTIGSIIGKKQAQKISGVLVDMQTALVIMKVWNALNKSNRSKFEKLPIKKMATVAWKLMK